MDSLKRDGRTAFITLTPTSKPKKLSNIAISRGKLLAFSQPTRFSRAFHSITFYLEAKAWQMRSNKQKAPSLRIIYEETVRTKSSLPEDCDQQVLVTIKSEDLGGRQRRISGSILISAQSKRVWDVLTAYDKIEAYMPNIVSSTVKRLNGQIFLDQIGIISRRLHLRTRMLLRVEEDFEHHTILFIRVKGRDFQEFVGKYIVNDLGESVRLDYEVLAIPFPLYPISLVDNKAAKEIPRMLASIRDEVVLGKHVLIC